jgi:hypothetical protein
MGDGVTPAAWHCKQQKITARDRSPFVKISGNEHGACRISKG